MKCFAITAQGTHCSREVVSGNTIALDGRIVRLCNQHYKTVVSIAQVWTSEPKFNNNVQEDNMNFTPTKSEALRIQDWENAGYDMSDGFTKSNAYIVPDNDICPCCGEEFEADLDLRCSCDYGVCAHCCVGGTKINPNKSQEDIITMNIDKDFDDKHSFRAAVDKMENNPYRWIKTAYAGTFVVEDCKHDACNQYYQETIWEGQGEVCCGESNCKHCYPLVCLEHVPSPTLLCLSCIEWIKREDFDLENGACKKCIAEIPDYMCPACHMYKADDDGDNANHSHKTMYPELFTPTGEIKITNTSKEDTMNEFIICDGCNGKSNTDVAVNCGICGCAGIIPNPDYINIQEDTMNTINSTITANEVKENNMPSSKIEGGWIKHPKWTKCLTCSNEIGESYYHPMELVRECQGAAPAPVKRVYKTDVLTGETVLTNSDLRFFYDSSQAVVFAKAKELREAGVHVIKVAKATKGNEDWYVQYVESKS